MRPFRNQYDVFFANFFISSKNKLIFSSLKEFLSHFFPVLQKFIANIKKDISTIKNVEIVENFLSKICGFRSFSRGQAMNIHTFSTLSQNRGVEKRICTKNLLFRFLKHFTPFSENLRFFSHLYFCLVFSSISLRNKYSVYRKSDNFIYVFAFFLGFLRYFGL